MAPRAQTKTSESLISFFPPFILNVQSISDFKTYLESSTFLHPHFYHPYLRMVPTDPQWYTLPLMASYWLVSTEQPHDEHNFPTYYQGQQGPSPLQSFWVLTPAPTYQPCSAGPFSNLGLCPIHPTLGLCLGLLHCLNDYPLKFQFKPEMSPPQRTSEVIEIKYPFTSIPCHLPSSLLLYVLHCTNNRNLLWLLILLLEYKPMRGDDLSVLFPTISPGAKAVSGTW